MDAFTLAIGVAAVAYGLSTAYALVKQRSSLGTLREIRTRFGHTAGTALHVMTYLLFPVAFGVLAIMLGVQGKSIF